MSEQVFGKFLHHPTDCSCSQCIEHPSQAKIGVHVFPEKLAVVTMLSNPMRWRSRYANYWQFERHCADAGAVLYTVELAFGGRHFEITEPNNPRHLQLRVFDELWLKENALNLLIARILENNVAWIDADTTFARYDWAQEALHQLQHYKVIQMFSHMQNLGPNHEPMETFPGYAFSKVTNPNYHITASYPYGPYGHGSGQRHPGFAWAARKEVLSQLGGLIDWAIMGSGDWHMATALFGECERSLFPGYTDNYKNLIRQWQDRAEEFVKRNVGYMDGLILHHYHGRMRNRKYNERSKEIIKLGYDPLIHVKKDWQGLWQLNPQAPNAREIRDCIMNYNRQRNEDTVEV